MEERRTLTYSVYDQQPIIAQGEIVENKRLGAVLGAIRAIQDGRDSARLAAEGISAMQSAYPECSRGGGHSRSAGPARTLDRAISRPVADFLARFAEEQRLRRRKANDVINERKRQRQIEAALSGRADAQDERGPEAPSPPGRSDS